MINEFRDVLSSILKLHEAKKPLMNPEEIQAIEHQIAVFSVFVEELYQKTKSGEIINSSFLARKLGSFKELKGLLEAV